MDALAWGKRRSLRILVKSLYVTFKRQIPGHNTPSVQLLGSVSPVQACWVTACNTSTRLGSPFFNKSAEIESTSAALWFFRYFSAPSPFYYLTARHINVNSIISQIDWTCWLLRFRAFVQVFFKMFFPSRRHWIFVG
jgi:hypothetical protein